MVEINTCVFAQHARTHALVRARVVFTPHIFPSWLRTAASNQSNGRLHVTTTGRESTIWRCPAIHLHGLPSENRREQDASLRRLSLFFDLTHCRRLLSFIHVFRGSFMSVQRRCYVWPPGGPYLFTPQVGRASHAPSVEEQRGPLALFPRPPSSPADGQTRKFLFNHRLLSLAVESAAPSSSRCAHT